MQFTVHRTHDRVYFVLWPQLNDTPILDYDIIVGVAYLFLFFVNVFRDKPILANGTCHLQRTGKENIADGFKSNTKP